VALHFDSFADEPLRGERKARAADIAEEWRMARHGVEVVAHGALVCPQCDAPVVVSHAVPAQRGLSCGFCGHTDRARSFLVRDVFDTVANEAYLVARLAQPG
jgi:hypothetical protein